MLITLHSLYPFFAAVFKANHRHCAISYLTLQYVFLTNKVLFLSIFRKKHAIIIDNKVNNNFSMSFKPRNLNFRACLKNVFLQLVYFSSGSTQGLPTAFKSF